MASYRQLVLGELETNCYVVWDEDSRETLVIDPADSAEIIGDFILSNNLELKIIGLTHGHFDHLMAAAELKLNFGTLLAMNFEDSFLWQRQTKTAQHFTGNKYLKLGEMTKIDVDLGKTSQLIVGQNEVEIIKIPGHTPGSVAFFLPQQKWLFSGDLLFEGGIGSSQYSYSDRQKLEKSIGKIKRLPPETLVLPGHGECFSLGNLV